jgi:type II secretory pathway component GspD/PulD (secretin)
MRTSRIFASLAVAAALAPATARAQGGDAAKTGEDIKKFLDHAPDQAAHLKREIDVSVEDADLRDVMDEIGRRVGRNIIVEPEIHEKVTISLRKIPWRDAVDVIAKMTKCEVEQRGSILVLTQPPKVTIQFTDANVRTVLQLLAAYSGKNIIISPEVHGDVTLDLHEVHWLRALHAIVKTVGDYEVVEETADLLRIVPRSSIALQLKTEFIPLKYLRPPAKYVATPPRTAVNAQASAAGTNLFIGSPAAPTGDASKEFTLFRALQNIVNSSKLGTGGAAGSTIEYDQQKNAFIVRGTQPLIEELKKIILQLDLEPSQVYVEVRFISTSDDDLLDYGIQPADTINGLSFSGPFPSGQITTLASTSTPVAAGGQTFTQSTGYVTAGKGINNNGSVATQTFALGTAPPVGTFPFAFGDGISAFAKSFQVPGILDFRGLQMTLNLIDTDTRTRLLQTPSLFLRDNEDAIIFVGENVPFAQVNTTPDINGNVVQAIGPGAGSPIAIGFSLFVSAHVVPETDRIMMTVIPRVSSPGGTSGDENIFDNFQIGTLSIQLPHTREQALVTHVMLDDGQTAVIGGLLTESDDEIIVRVPILSHIPLIGTLFTHTHREKSVSNLLILITTTIIRTRAQSIALYKRHDAQWKARDYFYKKYERPAADDSSPSKDSGSGASPLQSSTSGVDGGNMPSGGGADQK